MPSRVRRRSSSSRPQPLPRPAGDLFDHVHLSRLNHDAGSLRRALVTWATDAASALEAAAVAVRGGQAARARTAVLMLLAACEHAGATGVASCARSLDKALARGDLLAGVACLLETAQALDDTRRCADAWLARLPQGRWGRRAA